MDTPPLEWAESRKEPFVFKVMDLIDTQTYYCEDLKAVVVIKDRFKHGEIWISRVTPVTQEEASRYENRARV